MALRLVSKPRSRMRSASSMTSTCMLDASKPTVSSKCCSSRPGVHTSRFILVIRSASSALSLPPMTRPADSSCCLPGCA
eukprot:scaffold84273_cov33-Phaeocystis_antarctica.AAC.1